MEGYLKIQDASKKFQKPEITIRRWIKRLKESDYAQFEKCVVKETTKSGYFYLISEKCLIKKYGVPNQKEKVIRQKPKVISQNHDQKPKVPNQNEKVSRQNDKAIKGLKHWLENVRFENIGLKKDVEHLNQNIQNREQALLRKETEMKEREQKLHSSLIQLGIEKGRADGLENQIKLLTTPVKRWWQK